MPSDYCTLDDVLLFVSPTSQARLTTDAGRPWPLGLATATPKATWDTPFIGATTLTARINGVVQAGTTLSVGTGPNGTDQVIFAVPPEPGMAVSVAADALAINTAIVQKAITVASRKIDGYIAGRYATPVTDPVQLEIFRGVCELFVKWTLRARRDMEMWDPLVEEWKATTRWLELVAQAKIPLAASVAESTVTLPASPAYTGHEKSVFDPPFSGAASPLDEL